MMENEEENSPLFIEAGQREDRVEELTRNMEELQEQVRQLLEGVNTKDRRKGSPRREETVSRANELVPRDRDIGMRLPRGGWLQNPFGELTFKGRDDRTNPIRFV